METDGGFACNSFFFKWGTFSVKIASCGPSTSWEGKNGSQLLVFLLHSWWDRVCVDFGDVYVAVRTNYMYSFQMLFSNLLSSVFFVFCLQNLKSACMVKCWAHSGRPHPPSISTTLNIGVLSRKKVYTMYWQCTYDNFISVMLSWHQRNTCQHNIQLQLCVHVYVYTSQNYL